MHLMLTSLLLDRSRCASKPASCTLKVASMRTRLLVLFHTVPPGLVRLGSAEISKFLSLSGGITKVYVFVSPLGLFLSFSSFGSPRHQSPARRYLPSSDVTVGVA